MEILRLYQSIPGRFFTSGCCVPLFSHSATASFSELDFCCSPPSLNFLYILHCYHRPQTTSFRPTYLCFLTIISSGQVSRVAAAYILSLFVAVHVLLLFLLIKSEFSYSGWTHFSSLYGQRESGALLQFSPDSIQLGPRKATKLIR